MNKTKPAHPQPLPGDFQRPTTGLPFLMLSFKLGFVASLLCLAGVFNAQAAAITLTTSDGGGTTSFNTAGHWSNAAAPSAGNTYAVNSGITLRTPNPITSGNNYIFLGDSLSINSGGTFLGKIGNNTANSAYSDTITITNLILNGGWFHQADVNNDSSILTVAGNVNVTAASTVAAIGVTSGNGLFNTLEFTAPISGSAALLVSGPAINSGADSGLVKLSAANPYGGTITVSNALTGGNSVIASSVNRIMQLANVNAASNATLNLVSVVANPVSFLAAANTGAFNIGALSGTANEILADTAGAAVTLSLGGNNASTAYAGILSGSGSLVKTGSGTQTLSNPNTYTGSTAINAGTLKLSNSGSLVSSNITIAAGATFDVSAQTTPVLAANQNLLGAGVVNGSLTTAAASKIYPGVNGTAGTLTFNNNLTIVTGSTFNLDVSTSASSGNDAVTVTGALALNNTTLNVQALAGAAVLDTSADYILITAASISGAPNSTVTWVGTPPVNASSFTVVTSSTQVKLHYSAGTPLAGTGASSPSTVTRNESTLLTIAVTPGTVPASTGITVAANLTAIGGSAAQAFYDDGTHGDITGGDGTYSFSATVPPEIAAANITINSTVTDAESRLATPTIALSVVPASLTWNGGAADDNLSSNPNWLGGLAPGYVGDSLTFAGTTRLTPNLQANYSVPTITFDSTAGSFVIGSAGFGLTLTGGGVINNSASAQTFNLPITTAAAGIFTAEAGDLTLEQAVTNAGNAVTVAGSFNTTINGAISGTGRLIKTNGGSLILNGVNLYTGATVITNGTLHIVGAGLLGGGNYAGNISNAGILEFGSSANQTLSGVVSGSGSVVKDGSGTLILAGVNTYVGATTISSGVLQVAGSGSLGGGNYAGNITDDATFQYSSAAAQILSGILSGSGGVVKDGAGTLSLNGQNTYAGATVVSGGTLAYSPVTVSYPTVNTLSVSNAALTINASSSSTLLVSDLTFNKNSTLNLNYDFAVGTPTVAAIGATTSLSILGTGFTINISGYGATVGQFPLLAYPGTPLPDLSNVSLGLLPPGITANLVNNQANNSIDLAVTAVSQSTWIPLTGTDGFGTSSFNSAGLWADGIAPSGANGYYTKTNGLRTPANVNPYTFGGAALSVDVGGHLLGKTSGTTQVITINNLILNGGYLDQATANSDSFSITIAGNITVNAPSSLGAIGGTVNGSGSFEVLNLTAPISGSAALQISGPLINNGGEDTGVVRLSAANPYSGTMTVSSGFIGGNGVIASSIQRILQLNNLDAVKNATLNLNSVVASPVSFASAVNTGAFNVGALAGTSSQALKDTAGAAVQLSVGGNNTSSTFAGALTDLGSLTKTGNGTLTLNGANTYSGGTVVNAGTLAGVGSLASAATVAANGTLFAGTNGVGTLTFANNLTLNALSTNAFAVTTVGGASNHVVVAGTLSPNGSVIKITSGATLQFGTNLLFSYGAISGAFNPTPVFDVAPIHSGAIRDDGAGHISLVVSNAAPVAGATFTLGATAGQPTSVKIVGGKYSPTDADGDPLTITVGGAANGTVTTDGTNVIYTASDTVSGPTADSFTYTVSDAFGGTASQTVSVNISAAGVGFNQISAPHDNGDGTWTIGYLGVPNYNYALETTASLTAPVVWTPVLTNAAAANGHLDFTFSTAQSQGFFRTRQAK